MNKFGILAICTLVFGLLSLSGPRLLADASSRSGDFLIKTP